MSSEHDSTERRPEAVFRHHLELALTGSVEDDLASNYGGDVVVLSGWGIFRGHDGVRQLARQLEEELPNCTFRYGAQLVAGELAFLEWSATCDAGQVRDGADSFVIRDGRIVAQTIHYTVEP